MRLARLLVLLTVLFFYTAGGDLRALESGDYRLKGGDVLEIVLLEDPAVGKEYKVGLDGKILLPLLGGVDAAGKTLNEFNRLLSSEFSRFYVDPHVSVSLKKINRGVLFVSGEVAAPGEVEIEKGMTLAKLLIKRGLNDGSADLAAVKVFRGDEVRNVDFAGFLAGENSQGSLELEDGDIVYVPKLLKAGEGVRKKAATGRVTVTGAVQSAGEYEIFESSRVLDILTLAGWNATAANLEKVTVLSIDGTSTVCDIQKIIKGESSEGNIVLKPLDTVIVPEKDRIASRIILAGAFRNPGVYTIDSDRGIKIKETLILADGYRKNADLAHAVISRASGLKEPVDLYKLLFDADSTQDVLVRPGDAVLIPEQPLVEVYVLGMVDRPGLYSRYGSMNVFQALTFARHPTFGAKLSQTRIIRGWPDDPEVMRVDLKKLLKGDLTDNIDLKNGDVIYVPETIVSDSLEFWNKLLGPALRTVVISGKYEQLNAPGAPGSGF